MIYAALLVAIATLREATGQAPVDEPQTPYRCSSKTCQQIAASTSTASQVFGFGSSNYFQDISHWASSSTQLAACSFEPGTPEDVGVALRILGQTNTPFAVKGGGHATNPGFSSTTGVQIAMSRFSDVVYNPDAQTATIGAGLIWDDVYTALEPHGVNVAGGRVSGVGVAGLTLGGGYSWHTNQHGLTIDTVQAFELVTPNGTVLNVTETSSPDLFFALKGGLNNFGIVTRFTLKTFPQTQVWAGVITYAADQLDKANQAVANFAANNTDPRAAMVAMYSHASSQLGIAVTIFYDAPTPPSGVFEEFLSIPSSTRDVWTRSFSSFIQSSAANTGSGSRVISNAVSPTSYPLSFLESVVNETIYWGEHLSGSVDLVSYLAESFLSTLFTHNTTQSAYPPDRAHAFFPVNVHFAWSSSETDQVAQDAARTSAKTLQAYATACGPNDVHPVLYPNYAIFDTPLVNMYGKNLPRLRAIKAAVDPDNIMGLTGGFKL